MSPSTKRALRTGYQVVVALIVIVPVLIAGLPVAAQAATILGAVAGVAKMLNALEDAKILPSWLKGDAEVKASEIDSTPGIVPVVVPVPESALGGPSLGDDELPVDPEA